MWDGYNLTALRKNAKKGKEEMQGHTAFGLPAITLVARPFPSSPPSLLPPLTPMSSAPLPVFVAHSGSRAVRFDDQCVLIPQCSSSRGSRRPKVVTKSYSLPLWKRRSTSATMTPASDSDCTDDGGVQTSTSATAGFASSPEETHVVLRVPIPSFVRSTSGTSRSPSTSPTIPLSPCLVYRSPSAPVSPISPTRRPSLPIYHRRPDDQTVPLRPCCPDCVPITEESLKEGSTLKERFTRGARRRRSASLDSTSTGNGSIVVSSSSTLISPSCSASSSSSSTSKVSSGLTPSALRLGETQDEPLPTFTLTVDEVDKRRRRSQEGLNSSSSSRSRFDLTHQQQHSSSLSHNSPELIIPRKASPIAEEDESELFPLPSPRRSPSSSPNGSSSPNKTSPQVSPKSSPVPSPADSNVCLHPSTAAVAFPAVALKKEEHSVDALGSELEEKLSSSVGISRKDKVGLGASTSRRQKPVLTLVSSNSPTSSSMANASSNHSSFTPSYPRHTKSPRSTTTPRSFSATSPLLNSKRIPSSSPNSNARKGSFTLPFLKAGGAVLKGVSSISGGGAGV